MDSNLLNRQVVSRDTFADNNNVKVVFSKTSDGVDDLEEGELSDDGSPEEMSQREVKRPDVPDLLRDVERVHGEKDKRNPWGGVFEGWAAGVRGRESLETNSEDTTLKITRKSVKERLGWKRREEPGPEPDWKVKMKRPRMEMVADMEERKGSVRNRLYGAKRTLSEDRYQKMNPLEWVKGPVGISGKDVLDQKIVRSVLNDVETQNRDDLVERDFPPLSARFMGSLERRPRCRETIKRTVEFGDLGEVDSRKRKGNAVQLVESVANNLRKESVDSLENDNGSDLDDDSSMLIQVIQSDVASSDEESKKIREAVVKIEEAKKREETRRMELIEKEERTNLVKGSKNRKELKNQKLKDEEKIRFLKQKTKEMRVREKLKALGATEKKLLMEKSRQDRIRRKIKSKKSAKDSKVKEKAKGGKLESKVDSDESESSGTESDSSSSSSSDTSEDDSSSDSSGHEDVKKRNKSCSRGKKQSIHEKNAYKGKGGWSTRAASTPKKETSKVQKAKESSEEYKGKVSDLKSKLKDYLKKAKEKKMI